MLYFIAVLAFLFIGADAAHAEPISAAILGFSGWLAGLGATAKFLLTAGLIFGQSLLSKALAKKQKGQEPKTGVTFDVKMGDDNPVTAIVGMFATSGKRKYVNTWGQAGKTPNAYLVDVLELSNIPVGGLVDLYINDKKCTLSTAGGMVDNMGYAIPEFNKDGGPFAFWRFHDGTQTTADDYLVSKFAANDKAWTNAMIGRGVAYIVLTYRYHQDLFNNSLPAALVVTSGIPLYDPRKDSTVGGSGTHRWGQPETYQASNNPMVQAYNISRGIYYNGEWFYGGQNLGAKRLPRSAWVAAMNACDANRTLEGGGTEPMFRSGLELQGSDVPINILDYLRSSCNGRLTETGGKLKAFAGELGAAEMSFTDADIIITKGQTYEPFPNLDSVHNGATATYPEPKELWANKDAAPYYSADLEEDDGDRRLVAALSYPTVPYPIQVQALMRTAVEEGRRFRTHQFWLPPSYWVNEPGDILTWSSATMGYTNKKFMLLSIEGELAYNQLVTLRETDPLDYGWSPTYQLPDVNGNPGPVIVPPQILDGWNVTSYAVKDGAGVNRRPAIRVVVASDLDDLTGVRVQVRVKATEELVHDQTYPYRMGVTYSWVISELWTLPSTEYEVRGFPITSGRRDVDWTGWTSVTTTNLAFQSQDVLDNAIIASKIADAAVTANKLMDEAVTNIKLAAQAVSEAKLAVGAVTQTIIANGAVIASKIADGAIGVAKFATGLEPVGIISSGPLPTVKTTSSIYYNGALYSWDPATSTYKTSTVGPGSITQTEIADNSISTPKLQANAVIADKIAANAITVGKIAAGAVTATAIAAQSVTTKHLVIADWSNILPDNNLLDLSLWTQVTGTWQFILGSQGGTHIGVVSARAPSSGAVAVDLRSPRFPIENLKSYGFGAEIDITTGSTPLSSVNLEFYDGNDVLLSTATVTRLATDTSAASGRFYNEIGTAPAGTVYGVIRLNRQPVSGAISGTLDFFNVYVRRAGSSELIVDGAIIADKIAVNAVTTAKIAAGSVTATEIATGAITAIKIAAGTITGDKVAANTLTGDLMVANSITARSLVLTDFTNLIQNWDFSDITKVTMDSLWDFTNGSYVETSSGGAVTVPTFRYSVTTSYVETGQYAFVFDKVAVGNTTSMYMTTKNLIPVTSGETLYWEAQVLTAGAAATAGFYFRFYWYDRTGAAISPASTDGVSNVGVPAAYGTKKSGKVVVPADASYCKVRIYDHSTNTLTRYFVMDRIVVRRANSAELIVDGSITADMINVNSLTAISANFGNATVSGKITSTNGKMVQDFNLGTIVIYS